MSSLRKNVASQVLTFGLVNASSGAALTGATFTAKAWVTGDGTQAGFAGTFTELGNGQYKYVPTQTESNVTSFGLFIAPTSAVPVNIHLFTDNWDTTAAVITSGTGAAQLSVSSGQVILQSGSGTGQLDFTSGVVKANAVQLLGTAWLTPGTAGTPDVNAKLIGGTAQTGLDIGGNWTAARAGYVDKIQYLPAVLAGNAGGLFIAGTNAATTVTTSFTTTFTGNLTGTIGNLASGAKTDVENAVWDATAASHNGAGTTGNKLNAAASAGDPWTTALPGAYGAGTAGNIVGNNLNAKVGDVKTKTDNLPASPAAVSDIPTATQNADTLLARDLGSGSGLGSLNERTVRAALRFIRNKWTVITGVLTVTKEDDTTTAWTAAVGTTPGADPITSNDPT
jgi:hypothetical protein